MMNRIPNNIDKIIARILSGEALVDDILIFNSWLNEKEEHWQEFLLLKSFWEADVGMETSCYPELAYEKHIRQIVNDRTKLPKKYRRTLLLSIAASVLVLLGITFMYRMYEKYVPVEYYTYVSTEEISEFDLADGTHVKLNRNSKLTYTGDYGKKDRSVKLEGEAYFSVVKNSGQVFKVDMGSSTIEVLGTEFNVCAYSGKEEIIATLEKGRIRFCSDNEQVNLDPDQQLIYHKETGKIDVIKVEPELFTAWKDRIYRYHSISMKDLGLELEKIYCIEINVPKRLENVEVSGSFEYGRQIEDVLGIMQKSLAFKWKKQENKIIIQ